MEFSIIVPVYNTSSFLKACIASVKAQGVSDWELILVDDGSTDGSAELLNAYAKTDARIRVFRQENRGQFFARQKGMAEAKGEYLLFLDSDDELMPDCLTTLQAAFRKEPLDMVLYTGKILRNGCDSGRVFGRISEKEERVSVLRLKESLISCNDLNSLCLKAFRHKLFLGDDTDYSSLEGLHCGEDKVQLLYAVTQAEKILYIPNCLYCYRHRADSTMHCFEVSRIAKLLAGEMFSMLRLYMEKWKLDDRPHQERLALYQMKTYLSVYFGVRKCCATAQEKRTFREYPWKEYTALLAPYSRFIRSRLCLKDRVKLHIAKMQR